MHQQQPCEERVFLEAKTYLIWREVGEGKSGKGGIIELIIDCEDIESPPANRLTFLTKANNIVVN